MSNDAPAGNVNGQVPEHDHGRYRWLRWAALAVVAIVLAVEVALAWDQLAKAARSLYWAKWWWLLASALAAVLLMHSFAEVQRTLLASAGVGVQKLRSEAAYYAANSLSTTLPGGPVIAATFLLRQQRLWGAPTLVASWQLVMSGVLQAVGLALLGLGGAFVLGAKNKPFSLLFTLGAQSEQQREWLVLGAEDERPAEAEQRQSDGLQHSRHHQLPGRHQRRGTPKSLLAKQKRRGDHRTARQRGAQRVGRVIGRLGSQLLHPYPGRGQQRPLYLGETVHQQHGGQRGGQQPPPLRPIEAPGGFGQLIPRQRHLDGQHDRDDCQGGPPQPPVSAVVMLWDLTVDVAGRCVVRHGLSVAPQVVPGSLRDAGVRT